MMIWPNARAAFRAGLPVIGKSGLRATIGLIVANSSHGLFGLTVATAVPPGARARLLVGDRQLSFDGSATAMGGAQDDAGVHRLLSLLPISESQAVEPLLGGLEAPSAIAPIWHGVVGDLLLARASGSVRMGKALGAGASVLMNDPVNGEERLFSGAFRIDCNSLMYPIEAGEAGTAVLTADGRVLGILIGTIGDQAFVAPLENLMQLSSLVLMGRHTLMDREARRAEEVRTRRASARGVAPEQSEMEFVPAREPASVILGKSDLQQRLRELADA